MTAHQSDRRPAPVFLCHSSGDKERVRELYRQLVDDGVDCWLDEEDLLPGQDWAREIGRAIRSSDFVLACLSEHSITTRGFLQNELRRALEVADEQPDGSIFLIPLRLEQCEIPDRLRHLQYVDLFVPDGYVRLLKTLRREAPPSHGSTPRHTEAPIRAREDGNGEVVSDSRQGWLNGPRATIIAAVIALLGVLVTVLVKGAPSSSATSAGAGGPAAATVKAKIINSGPAGVFKYEAPSLSSTHVIGPVENVSVPVVCQVRNGEPVSDDDPVAGQPNNWPVWDKTDDGYYIADVWTDLPKDIGNPDPPAGLPLC